MSEQLIEIEVVDELNSNLRFLPIPLTVRGRWDWSRTREPEHKTDAEGPYPGQVIGVNLTTRETYIRESLHESKYSALRERIEKKAAIPPKKQSFPNVDENHIATWIHWMRRAIESQKARLIKGEFPESVEGTPRTVIYRTESNEKNILNLLAAAVYKDLPAGERK